MSDNGIGNTHFQGLVGTVLTASGDPLNGVVHAHQTRQTHGAAEAREQAQLHFRQTDLGLLAQYAEVRSQTHFQAATQGDAIHGNHFGNVQIFKGIEDLVGFQTPAGDFVFRQFEHVCEFGDVGANDENPFAGGHDQALDVVVACNGVDSLTEIFHGFLVELVDGFALKIELQFGDAVVKQLYAYGVALIDHSVCSPVPKYATQ